MGFYLDEQVSRAVANGLTRHGHDVIMALDVGMMGKADDDEHLPFARKQGRIMVTFDRPFAGRTMSHTDHAGLVVYRRAFDMMSDGRFACLLSLQSAMNLHR